MLSFSSILPGFKKNFHDLSLGKLSGFFTSDSMQQALMQQVSSILWAFYVQDVLLVLVKHCYACKNATTGPVYIPI